MRRKQVYTIHGFLNNEPPIRVEGGLNPETVRNASLMVMGASLAVTPVVAMAATVAPVSAVFDAKIWPLFLDVGKPLAKTMIALGIYRTMRNDADRGWKMVQRAGMGLVCLYLIDGAIHILVGVGQGLQQY